jgi:hypothetical protein
VNVADRIVVGVIVGELLPGEDFLGALVGFKVGGDEYVGQVAGLSVGFSVGDCVGTAVFAAAREVCWESVGNGVKAGWSGMEIVGDGGSESDCE